VEANSLESGGIKLVEFEPFNYGEFAIIRKSKGLSFLTALE
jgi:hypothetical protein